MPQYLHVDFFYKRLAADCKWSGSNSPSK